VLDGGVVPPCTWSAPINNTYLAGYVHGKSVSLLSLSEAKAACLNDTFVDNCGGVVSRHTPGFPMRYELRAGTHPIKVPDSDGEASYMVTNRAECVPTSPATIALWRNRSRAAYGAVVRADGPDARWVYQGYALNIGGNIGHDRPGALEAFTSAVPYGQFILLDMSAHGEGQWRDKNWKGQQGLPFIWTSLHTYGGAISIKGNLTEINAIPFAAPPLAAAPAGYKAETQAVGVGYTPEGLDQNTAYYELLQEAAFRPDPVANLTDWLVDRAHRRYGLGVGVGLGRGRNPNVSAAWVALGASG
jgi:hypothetical protein